MKSIGAGCGGSVVLKHWCVILKHSGVKFARNLEMCVFTFIRFCEGFATLHDKVAVNSELERMWKEVMVAC
jgi:hypothetical protein